MKIIEVYLHLKAWRFKATEGNQTFEGELKGDFSKATQREKEKAVLLATKNDKRIKFNYVMAGNSMPKFEQSIAPDLKAAKKEQDEILKANLNTTKTKKDESKN